MVTVTLIRPGTARTRDPELQSWSPDPVPAPARLDLPHPYLPRDGEGMRVQAGPESGSARSARNSLPPAAPGWGSLWAAGLLLQQHQMLRALRRNPARHRLPDPPASALTSGQQMLSNISYSPLRPPLRPVAKDSAKVRTVPVPLKGPSPGSATSAPKQHGVSGERRGRGRGHGTP